MTMMRYLVVHDVDAIQAYVFATGKLREVRGASALIDQINRRETGRLIRHYHGRQIYLGGGGAAADFTDESRAQGFCTKVSEIYAEKTWIASSTGVVESYDESVTPEAATSFRSALRKAHANLRQTKAGAVRKTQLLSCPYFKLCQACGIYPAAAYDRSLPEEAGFVCQACYAKRQMPREPFIQRYIRWAAQRDSQISPAFPRFLDEIGKAAEPQGYIGVIYADGNRMGDRLQHLETWQELRAFSRTVDSAVKQALTEALLQRYRSTRTQGQRFPALVPLCGGDDLVVVVPGHEALRVAVDYLQGFQNRVRHFLPEAVAQRIGGREMSACAGVAIAKSHTPLISLFDLAYELCQSAKARSYEYARPLPLPGQAPQEVPCLDFQVLTTPSWSNVREVRATEYMLNDRIRLTARPYTAEEVRRLLKAVQILKQAKFPPGKLYDLYRGLRAGKQQAVLRYLTLFMRAQESSTGYKQQTALKDAAALVGVNPAPSLAAPLPPWQPWPGPGRGSDWLQTPYGDMVEIYAFVRD